MATVHWTKEPAGTHRPDDTWWRRLADAHDLPTEMRRVVVYVAAPNRNAIVVETARSLIAFYRAVGVSTVDVVDPGGRAADWLDAGWLDVAGAERLRVDAACLRGGAMVPTLWLDDFFLVLVTGVAPDPRWGLSAVLAAQAELLLDPHADDLGAMFEAHRLLSGDLNIACGTRIAGTATSETWWAASRDDVSLESAIAIASGATPSTLPHLRYFARHETMSSPNGSTERVVALEHHVASADTIRVARRRATIARFARMAREDIGLAAANLHRIPQFIERRWPGLLPFGLGAT